MKTWPPTWRPSRYIDDYAGGGRRQAPRCEARLKAFLRVHDSTAQAQDEGSGHETGAIICETRNLSETGLAVSIPSQHTRGHYFNVVGSIFQIIVDLPAGPVRMLATPKWCQWATEEGREKSYLVGLRITEMSDEEWVLMVRYIHASIC